MKRFFALVALVFGLVACQTEPENLGVNLGNSVETVINIALPESTRGSDDTSFDNGVLQDHSLRYIMEVYLWDEETGVYTKFDHKYEKLADDATSISIPIQLVPNRRYRFVVWADFVHKGTTAADKDLYYETSAGLRSITVLPSENKWTAMDEARDAFTGTTEVVFNGTAGINVSLTRPLAKLRVMTTDYHIIKALDFEVKDIVFAYTLPVFTGFDAFSCEANGESTPAEFTYAFNDYYNEVVDNGDITLFTDLIFANNESKTVKFDMVVKDQKGTLINTLNFTTDIPLRRNTITTIKGSLLTNSNDITVDLEQDYSEPGREWPSNIKEELALVGIVGGEFTLTEDVVFTESDSNLVFVSDAIINLNGYTLTAGKPDSPTMTGTDIAAITVDNGATLTIYGNSVGEGAIVGSEYGIYVKNGAVNIVSGDIKAGTSAVQVNVGSANISGGKFSATGSDKRYVVNCIDSSWKNGKAKVNITGGIFANFNPANNAAEGANTNFVVYGYKSRNVEGSDTDYEVYNATISVNQEELTTILSNLQTTQESEVILKLVEDITSDTRINVPAGKDVILDLNDKKIFRSDDSTDSYVFYVNYGGSLTITGDGTVETETPGYVVFCPVGDLVIESGTFIRHIPEGYTGNTYSMFSGTKPAGGWDSTGVTIKGGYFDCGYYPTALKNVDIDGDGDIDRYGYYEYVEELIAGTITLYETQTDINKRGQSTDPNVTRNAIKNLCSAAFNRSNNNFKVYGGTFVGANPAWGDEGGWLPTSPNYLRPWSYYQGAFLDGQKQNDDSIVLPEGYAITKGRHEDGRPTYTVTYSK